MWRYGDTYYNAPPILPQGPVDLPGGVVLGADRIWLIGIAAAVTAIAWAVFRFTGFGRKTSAVAESPFFASVYRLGATRIAIANWFISGTLAGLAGALLAPVIGLNVTVLVR